VWQVTSGDRLQSGGLKCRSDEGVRRRNQPRGTRDLAHLGGYVSRHHALHGDICAMLASTAVFGVQFAAKFLDEFLRHTIKQSKKKKIEGNDSVYNNILTKKLIKWNLGDNIIISCAVKKRKNENIEYVLLANILLNTYIM